MTPTTWLDHLRWLLLSPFTWIQCKAELPFPGGCSYCMRNKGHFGKHRTNDGELFGDSDAT